MICMSCPILESVIAMKKPLLFSMTLIASGLCLAQDVGRVLSATPVMQQVAVPRQVCATDAPGSAPMPNSASAAAPPAQDSQRCSVQTFYENHPVAYTVVYEFAGKQYTVQMPGDPGPQVQLQVAPVGAPPPVTVQPGNAAPQAVYPQQSPYVVVDQTVYPSTYPAYPAYYGAPYSPYYYPPFGVSIGLGWGGGYRGGYRRWR